MKKLLAAFLAFIGVAWWRKRADAPAAPEPDPAEALRAKLAEQREPEAEPEPAPEPEPQEDVAARRSEVHDRARQAMQDLSTPEE